MNKSIKNIVLQTNISFSSAQSLYRAPKKSYTNLKCIEKDLTMHYTERYWIKNLEICSKFTLKKMQTKKAQNNLKATQPTNKPTGNRETILELESSQPTVLVV